MINLYIALWLCIKLLNVGYVKYNVHVFMYVRYTMFIYYV